MVGAYFFGIPASYTLRFKLSVVSFGKNREGFFIPLAPQERNHAPPERGGYT